jgi:hypothetical protein
MPRGRKEIPGPRCAGGSLHHGRAIRCALTTADAGGKRLGLDRKKWRGPDVSSRVPAGPLMEEERERENFYCGEPPPGKGKVVTRATLRRLHHHTLLSGVPAMHTQSCRFAGREGLRNRLHAVVPEKDSSVANVEEYTEARDVVNHAYDSNQILRIPVSHLRGVLES